MAPKGLPAAIILFILLNPDMAMFLKPSDTAVTLSTYFVKETVDEKWTFFLPKSVS